MLHTQFNHLPLMAYFPVCHDFSALWQREAQQQPMAGAPLNASALAAAPPAVQKQMIGEKLYPAIAKHHPEMAGKVTGMMVGLPAEGGKGWVWILSYKSGAGDTRKY